MVTLVTLRSGHYSQFAVITLCSIHWIYCHGIFQQPKHGQFLVGWIHSHRIFVGEMHLAVPFRGTTGHSPAPWHSRQPHSRLALGRLGSKTLKRRWKRIAFKMVSVSFLLFLFSHQRFWMSLVGFTLGFPRKALYYQYFGWKKWKRWTMQSTPVCALEVFSIYGGAICPLEVASQHTFF